MSDDPLLKLREILDQVAAIKMPSSIRLGAPSKVVEGERNPLSAQQKISQLESYLLLTAEGRQLAIVSKLAASDSLFDIRQEIADDESWKVYMQGAEKNWTQPQVAAARRKADPERYRKMERLDWLLKAFDEQVRRLEGDDAAASRAYTMVTGT